MQLSADGLLMNKSIFHQTYPFFFHSAYVGLADYLWVKCWKLMMNIILVVNWKVEGTLVKQPNQGKIIELNKGNVYVYSELKSTTIKLIFVTLVLHTKLRNLRHSSEATKAKEKINRWERTALRICGTSQIWREMISWLSLGFGVVLGT